MKRLTVAESLPDVGDTSIQLSVVVAAHEQVLGPVRVTVNDEDTMKLVPTVTIVWSRSW